jgi:DNA-binding NarL/FixJ family response regulator
MKKGTETTSAVAADGAIEAQSAQEPIHGVVSTWAVDFDWTDAESDVFRMRANGKAVKDIAVLRCVKVDTVQKQVRSLRRKVPGAPRLQDLVEGALREAASRRRREPT